MDLRERAKGVAERALRTTWWRSVLWTLVCFFSTTLAVATGTSRADAMGGPLGETMSGAWVLIWFLGIALIGLVWLRRRWPWQAALIAAAVTAVLPIDPLVSLVLLMHVWIWCGWRVVGGVTAVVTVATFASIWRDTRGGSADESFWWMVLSSPESTATGALAAWVPVVLTVIVVALFATIGWVRRELRRSQSAEEGHRVVAAELSSELARQAERERIAREVHDVIGHRLSLLSVHAGALEAQTRATDDRLAGSASLVRESAAQTAADLRSLLDVLRRPDDPDLAQSVPGLGAVPGLVDETVAHGMHLVATVTIDGAATLDPLVGQTAYRVVQELLTNARRHAPGTGVRLVVSAGPGLGVTIETANRRTDGLPLVEGTGLTGLRERVAHVGGEVTIHVDDEGVLRAAVHLPWRFAATDDGAHR